MSAEALKDSLQRTFAATVNVRAVPVGYAISTLFEDRSGDPISFYLVEDPDGLRVEDDGDYLANLVARDIPIDRGPRGDLLDAILAESNSYWDRETYEIKSASFRPEETSKRVIGFISSLVRVRDLELLTREVVRSTFRDDVGTALVRRFGRLADIEENAPVSSEFSEYPADFVIRPRAIPGSIPGAIYVVNSNDKLNEALLLHMEMQASALDAFAVIGLIEDSDMRLLSRRKFQRNQNRSLPMPIFRGDEDAALAMIARRIHVPVRPAA